MRFDIVSLFPDFVAQIAAHGVVGRAGERGLLSLHGWNPRDYAEGNYRRVDARPPRHQGNSPACSSATGGKR